MKLELYLAAYTFEICCFLNQAKKDEILGGIQGNTFWGWSTFLKTWLMLANM